jgi:5-hydroxyisourate hydrolase-like protein (transthyretin family)
MNRLAHSLGISGSLWIAMLFSFLSWAAVAVEEKGDAGSSINQAQQDAPMEMTKATDKEHMLAIWKALMDYKKAHGKLPDYLSDLVPEYLPDKSVLMSPVQDDNRQGGMDPKFASSYSYEFGAAEFAGQGRTFREVKEVQMKEFGPVTPILRCFAHGDRVMSVAYSGDYFESELYWESSPEARALRKKLGAGSGFDEGEFSEVQVLDNRTGEAIAGAEVRLTQRQYHFLPLPDRTLKTDADGRVRVPLGPAVPPSRQLTVTVWKPGFYAPSETWVEGQMPLERTWRMMPGMTIGGVVKDHEGGLLKGAKVVVTVMTRPLVVPQPGQAPVPGLPPGVSGLEGSDGALQLQVVEASVTDAEGHWRCESVPKEMVELTLCVRHPEAWQTSYRWSAEEAEGEGKKGLKLDLDALLAQRAEFRLEPPVFLSGVLRGPDGAPLAGEEVKVTPRISEDGLPMEGGIPLLDSDTDIAEATKKLKTDEKGRFSLSCVRAQDLMLSAAPNDLSVVMRVVTVAPGLEPVEMKASVRRRLTIRARDADGKPATGVQVTFIGWADAPAELQIGATDEKGEFAWDAAPSDQIGLTFAGGGFSPSTEWVPAEKKGAVEVELKRFEEPKN